MYKKYTNVRTRLQGIEFDSRLEALRYVYLKNWERMGHIDRLRLQVAFELEEDGVVSPWAGRKYIADFVYTRGNVDIIEDVKSSWTAKNEIFRAKKQRLIDMGYHVREILPNYVPFLDLPKSIKYKQSVISKYMG